MAGTVGNLMCTYNLSSHFDKVSATWTFNGSAVEPDDSDRVSINGVNLKLSPVYTSDTGIYMCMLDVTSESPYVIFPTLDEASANVSVASKFLYLV